MVRIQNPSVRNAPNIPAAIASARDILQTFVVGCEEAKLPKAVAISVAGIHRLILHNAVHQVCNACTPKACFGGVTSSSHPQKPPLLSNPTPPGLILLLLLLLYHTGVVSCRA